MDHDRSASEAARADDWAPTEAEILSLEPQEVRRLVWEGVTVLDARSARDHALNPHRAAVHLCHQAPRHDLVQRCPDPREPLVCCSNKEARARRLAVRLSRLGYQHVYVLRGGLEALPAQLFG